MKTYKELIQHKNSVYELRKAGYKVRVLHQRFVAIRSPMPFTREKQLVLVPQFQINEFTTTVSPKGGETRIELTTPDGKAFTAEAKCNPIDHFNRKVAIRICLGRIAKQMEMLNTSNEIEENKVVYPERDSFTP